MGSRERLLAAAMAEFAARGFDGAKVDRIARAARVNKAMIYYHFRSKAALYREILVNVFGSFAGAVAAIPADAPAEERIRQYVRTMAARAVDRPHFPTIWLREIADGGRNIDAAILAELRRVIQVLAGILADGRREGVFGPAHPFVTQLSIVGPLLFFAASAPVRARFEQQGEPLAAVPHDVMLRHVEAATLGALRPAASPTGPIAQPRRHSK